MNEVIKIAGLKVACRPNSVDTGIAFDSIARDDYKVRQLSKSGGLFVDIGAYGGHVTLLAASLGMQCIVIEPLPANLENIRDNIRLNGFEDRVQTVQGAIGTSRIFWNDSSEEIVKHRYVANSSGSPRAEPLAVESVDLDKILGDRQIHLLKTDCEGGEWSIPPHIAAKTAYMVGEFHTIDSRTFEDFKNLFPTHEDVSANYGINRSPGMRLFVFRRK